MQRWRYRGYFASVCVCLMLSGCAFIGKLFGGDDAGGIEIITRPHASGDRNGGVMATLDVEDTLELVDRGDGGIDFRLTLIADTERSCRMHGTALPAGNGFEYREAVMAGEGVSQCLLRLDRGVAGWHLTDADGHCAAAHCDDGMHIDGIVFRAAPSPTE